MNHQSFSFQFIQFLQLQTEGTNKLQVQSVQLVQSALKGRDELTKLTETRISETRNNCPPGPMGTFHYGSQSKSQQKKTNI